MHEYQMKLSVFIRPEDKAATGFRLEFENIPEQPFKGAGYHAIYYAAAYLMSCLIREAGVKGENHEQFVDAIRQEAERLSEQMEIKGEEPPIPGWN